MIKESLEITFNKFDTIKDWSNLVKHLKRMIHLFTENKTPFIPHKQHLFRRLAQCLFSVPDIAVHQTVIDIYILILKNLQAEPKNIINDIPYITLGLFAYTQDCPNAVKEKIIEEIYKQYFLPLGHQIGTFLPALIGTLLPGLIDNNEKMRKQVFGFFDQLQTVFPIQLITLSVWTNISRSPKC